MGFLPSYIRNLTIEEIQAAPIAKRDRDEEQLTTDTFITEWMLSLTTNNQWIKASVEENGTLNLNRFYTAESGLSVQAKCAFDLPEEKEALLAVGFSDHLDLWVNEEHVYTGKSRWNPPSSDGRIRSSLASIPIRWKAGMNSIYAVITNEEQFGWGICVKTGLSNVHAEQHEVL